MGLLLLGPAACRPASHRGRGCRLFGAGRMRRPWTASGLRCSVPCRSGSPGCRLRTPSRGCAVTEVEFRLLGAMQLRVDDEPAKLPGAAERGLLALLLLSPGWTVAASSLIDRLWSESGLPADPLNALQLRVSKLRRSLAAHGLDVIRRDAAGYRIEIAPDQVDVHRFA